MTTTYTQDEIRAMTDAELAAALQNPWVALETKRRLHAEQQRRGTEREES